jgi:sulfur relay protein TusB/DsrH
VPVYVIKEDLAERGLPEASVHAGVKVIDRSQLVPLYEKVDQIWQW